jgi:hypothetical protein
MKRRCKHGEIGSMNFKEYDNLDNSTKHFFLACCNILSSTNTSFSTNHTTPNSPTLARHPIYGEPMRRFDSGPQYKDTLPHDNYPENGREGFIRRVNI